MPLCPCMSPQARVSSAETYRSRRYSLQYDGKRRLSASGPLESHIYHQAPSTPSPPPSPLPVRPFSSRRESSSTILVFPDEKDVFQMPRHHPGFRNIHSAPDSQTQALLQSSGQINREPWSSMSSFQMPRAMVRAVHASNIIPKQMASVYIGFKSLLLVPFSFSKSNLNLNADLMPDF